MCRSCRGEYAPRSTSPTPIIQPVSSHSRRTFNGSKLRLLVSRGRSTVRRWPPFPRAPLKSRPRHSPRLGRGCSRQRLATTLLQNDTDPPPTPGGLRGRETVVVASTAATLPPQRRRGPATTVWPLPSSTRGLPFITFTRTTRLLSERLLPRGPTVSASTPSWGQPQPVNRPVPLHFPAPCLSLLVR